MQDLYEEIEQCQLMDTNPQGQIEPSFRHEYKYNLITTVDVPVPWRPDRVPLQASGSGWIYNLVGNPQPDSSSTGDSSSLYVAVRLVMSQHGLLSFRVEEPEAEAEAEAPGNSSSSLAHVRRSLTMGTKSRMRVIAVECFYF